MSRDPLILGMLAVSLGLFTAVLLIPMFEIVANAFWYQGSPSTYWLEYVLRDPFYFPVSAWVDGRVPFLHLEITTVGSPYTIRGDTLIISGVDYGVILNTLMVAVTVTLISTAIGVTLAFFFSRYSFPGANALRTAMMVPILTTPFVGAVGLRRMISIHGTLNTIFYDYLHLLPYRVVFDGLAAVILVQSLVFYPIVMINAYATMVSIDPTMEEQAEIFGSSGFKLFRTITLPLAMPGIEAGSLLVFILSLEDLGTPIVFQGSNAEKLLTYQIFTKIFSQTGLILPEGTALAFYLLFFSMVAFFVIRKYVALKQYAMLSRGGTWRPRTRRIGAARTILVYAVSLTILFFALLPHIGVILLSVADTWGPSPIPESFSLKNFRFIVEDHLTFSSVRNSLIYSTVATLIIMVVGSGAAYVVSREGGRWSEILNYLATMPIAVPGIVVAAGLFYTYSATPLNPVINPAYLLTLAYSVRRMPFTVRSAFAGMLQTHVNLEEAAWNLGASRTRAFFNVVVPLVLPNVIGGAMLSFVYCMSEVSTSLVLGGANPAFAPITWKMADILYSLGGGQFPTAALGVLLMSLQLAAIVGSNVLLKQRVSALVGA